MGRDYDSDRLLARFAVVQRRRFATWWQAARLPLAGRERACEGPPPTAGATPARHAGPAKEPHDEEDSSPRSASRHSTRTALAADPSLAKVKEKGKLVLGLDDAFPPMGFRNDDNQIVGYDIDVAREVARRLGVQLVPQPIDWNAKEQELNTGKIDCIWNGFTITDERKKAIASRSRT